MSRALFAAVITSGAILASLPASASSGIKTPGIVAHPTFLAVVNGNGTIGRVSPATITSAKLVTGEYEVIFPRDVTACYYTVTSGTPGPSAQLGVVTTVARRDTNVNGIFVANYDTAGALKDSSFYAEVTCP